MTYHVPLVGASKTRVGEELRARNLDGLLLTSPENVYYMSGLPVLPGSGNPILFALRDQLPFFVYISATGSITLFCWIGATLGFTFDVDEVRSFFNWESANDELQEFLQATLTSGSRVGVERSCPWYVIEKLSQFVQSAFIIVSDDLLLGLRLSKNAAELAHLRKAIAIVEAAVADLRTHIRPGSSRLEVIQQAKRLLIEGGASGIGHTTIAFGTSNPEIAFDETLEPGKLVTLDLGAVVDGYVSDNRRYCYSGTIPDDLRHLHQTICGIVRQVGENLRPGVAFADVYNNTVELYEACGLPPFFISVGHSIGLQTEEAWISPDSTLRVQAGMVLNIELYSPYADGSTIGDEETFLVTESETLLLTQSDSAIVAC